MVHQCSTCKTWYEPLNQQAECPHYYFALETCRKVVDLAHDDGREAGMDDFAWDKRPHLGTVGELIERLRGLPPDTPLALSVYGHSYYSPCDRISHGPLDGTLVQLHYASGPGHKVYILHAGGLPDDGYRPTPVDL